MSQEVEALKAENAQLREALRSIPFAEYQRTLQSEPGDASCAWYWFRRAAAEHIRAALGQTEEGDRAEL